MITAQNLLRLNEIVILYLENRKYNFAELISRPSRCIVLRFLHEL